MKKRFFALLLALCLVVSLLPAQAVFAEGEGGTVPDSTTETTTETTVNGSEETTTETTAAPLVDGEEVVPETTTAPAQVPVTASEVDAVAEANGVGYETLAKAIAAGGDVKLLKNVTVNEMITIPSGVTVNLNLNGFDIEGGYQSGNNTKHIYVFDNLGTMKIFGTGTISGRGIYNGYNGGSSVSSAVMTIESGVTIHGIDVNGGYAVGNYANLTVYGATINVWEDNPSDTPDSGHYDATAVYNAGTAVLNGTKITSTTNYTYGIENRGTMTITSVNVTGGHGALYNTSGTTTVLDGTFVCSGAAGPSSDHVVYIYSGKVTINGGTFTNNNTDSGSNGAAVYVEEDGAAEINGGTFTGCESAIGGKGSAVVNGGSFDLQWNDTNDIMGTLEQYVAVDATVTVSGQKMVKTETGLEVYVEPVAQVGEEKFKTLQEAVNAADGKTVTVLRDVALSDTVTVPAGKTVTIALNGYNITGTPAEAKAYAVINNQGTLTITGEGTILCNHTLAGSTSYAVNTILNQGTLYVNGGVIENKSTSTNQIGYAIDNNSTVANVAVVIDGGKVTVSGSYYYDGIRQFCNSETLSNAVTVKSGSVSSIWMQNPSDGSAQNAKDAKGSIEISGGSVTGLYVEPSAAFTASVTGGKIGTLDYFQTAEGRDLTGFVTGGVFTNEPNAVFIAENHKCVKVEENCYAVHKHVLVRKEGYAATCKNPGAKDYYTCETCMLKYSDAAGKTEITDVEEIPVDDNAHTLKHVPAVPFTCTEDGMKEHYACEDCEAVFYDAEGKTAADKKYLVDDACHMKTHYTEQKATCTMDGYIDHYKCDACKKLFADEQFTKELTAEEVYIKAGHKLTFKEEVPAGEETTGMKAHYFCSACEGYFLDEAGADEVGYGDLIIFPTPTEPEEEKIEIAGELKLNVVKAITVTKDEYAYYSFTPAEDGEYLFYLPYENSPALGFFETNADGVLKYVDSDDYLSNGVNEGHVVTMKAGTEYVVYVSGEIEPYPATVQTSICVVKNGTVTGIAFREASIEMYAGIESYSADVIALPVGAVVTDVTYTTSDANVASMIKNGLGEYMISANNPGTVTITATTASGLTATCKVTVKAVPELKVGSVEALKIPSIYYQPYTFTPATSGTYSLYWTQDLELDVYLYGINLDNEENPIVQPEGVAIEESGKYGFKYEMLAGYDYTIQLVNNTETAANTTLYLTLPKAAEVVEEKVVLGEEVVDKIIEDAEDSKDVQIDLTDKEVVETPANTTVTSAQLPVAALEKVAEKEAALTVTNSVATVTMDTEALEAVAKQADGDTVTLVVKEIEEEKLSATQQEAVKDKKVAAVITAELICDKTGEKIWTENANENTETGTITVAIPFTPEDGYKGSDYSVIYVADDGTTKPIDTEYKNGCLVVELEHFSDYVIVNNADKGDGNEGGTDSGEAKPEETKPVTKPGNAAPNTGDNANIFGLFALLVVSGLLAVALLVLRKKQRA